tara:strand:- start:340 stop:873 length:534 start_codon:yes stop_codon:yes gene_type:complete
MKEKIEKEKKGVKKGYKENKIIRKGEKIGMIKSLRNKYFFIFIYTLILTGCDVSSISGPESCSDEGFLSTTAPSLEKDSNGYYHMVFNTDYIQTFSTLDANTGREYEKVAWQSNKEILISGHWTQLVNGSSYTDEDGVAHTVLGVWEVFIGDTIKVWTGYTTDCGTHRLDSLEVIID